MFYFEEHIGDTLRETANLSLVERGAFHVLEHAYIETEAPLPLEKKVLYRLCRVRKESERRVLDLVLSEFFTQTSEGFYHERFEAIIKGYYTRRETNKKNGALGGRPKANAKREETDRLPNANPPPPPTEPAPVNRKPVTSNQGTRSHEPEAKGSAAAQPPAGSPDPRPESWPTLDEVKQEADRHMVPAECAQKFWNEQEQVGWLNKHGVAIRNWRPGFANYATTWKANAFRASGKFEAPEKKETRAAHPLDTEPEGDWRTVLINLCAERGITLPDDVADIGWCSVPMDLREAVLAVREGGKIQLTNQLK